MKRPQAQGASCAAGPAFERPRSAGAALARGLAIALCSGFAAACSTSAARDLPPPPSPARAFLEGRVLARGEADSAAAAVSAVVYLIPIDAAPAAPRERAPEPPVLRHQANGFATRLTIVRSGEPLLVTNDDSIYHAAFSYSKPNAFSLPAYGPGESRTVRFETPGIVRVHCAVHDGESSVVLVVVGSLYTLPTPSGAYRLHEVPAGRYRLEAWSQFAGEASVEITLNPAERAYRDLQLRSPSDTGGPH
jgi:plastocyanin